MVSGGALQSKSIFVHFSFKRWDLVATVLIIFPENKLTKLAKVMQFIRRPYAKCFVWRIGWLAPLGYATVLVILVSRRSMSCCRNSQKRDEDECACSERLQHAVDNIRRCRGWLTCNISSVISDVKTFEKKNSQRSNKWCNKYSSKIYIPFRHNTCVTDDDRQTTDGTS